MCSAVPVPLRGTVCGLFAALSAMLSEAVRRPVADGRNATCTVQLAPTASVDPQRLVTRKSPLLAPLSVMLLRLRVSLPMFVRVTFKLNEVLFLSWVAKLRLEARWKCLWPACQFR